MGGVGHKRRGREERREERGEERGEERWRDRENCEIDEGDGRKRMHYVSFVYEVPFAIAVAGDARRMKKKIVRSARGKVVSVGRAIFELNYCLNV